MGLSLAAGFLAVDGFLLRRFGHRQQFFRVSSAGFGGFHAREHPGEFLFGANEVTDLPEATYEIEKYLKLGGVIIGEQKFSVECDSRESQRLYELAAERRVPILLHFQHGT